MPEAAVSVELTAFKAWASQAGQNGKAEIHPTLPILGVKLNGWYRPRNGQCRREGTDAEVMLAPAG
jgi:hypothetical protein